MSSDQITIAVMIYDEIDPCDSLTRPFADARCLPVVLPPLLEPARSLYCQVTGSEITRQSTIDETHRSAAGSARGMACRRCGEKARTREREGLCRPAPAHQAVGA